MTFTTVAGLTAADSITVMFMDEEMELIQDSDEISMMLEVIKSAVQVDVPEKEAFGPEIVISLSDGEKIDLRLIENEPTYVVTNYNICYDCGQNMFQLIDMAELLEEYGQ
jgi:hypothetical protein